MLNGQLRLIAAAWTAALMMMAAGASAADAAPTTGTIVRIDLPEDFKGAFLALCDLAAREVNAPTRTVPFYNDSYAVRAMMVAHDMTGKPEYLEASKQWADRMIEHQRTMIPAGAYYMNYNRKPGESDKGWYVADSSSIAMGILAVAVRCQEPAEKQRYLDSVLKFTDLVMTNFIGEAGGIRNGAWPRYDGEWWCSSGIFGSLMFLMHKETGEAKYLNAGLGTIDWLNALDMETAGPMTFAEMGATMPMYVLEAYSAAWPFLEKGSERYEAAVAQAGKSLEWMEKNQVGRGSAAEIDYHHQWGSKMGGLPFHMYVIARHTS